MAYARPAGACRTAVPHHHHVNPVTAHRSSLHQQVRNTHRFVQDSQARRFYSPMGGTIPHEYSEKARRFEVGPATETDQVASRQLNKIIKAETGEEKLARLNREAEQRRQRERDQKVIKECMEKGINPWLGGNGC